MERKIFSSYSDISYYLLLSGKCRLWPLVRAYTFLLLFQSSGYTLVQTRRSTVAFIRQDFTLRSYHLIIGLLELAILTFWVYPNTVILCASKIYPVFFWKLYPLILLFLTGCSIIFTILVAIKGNSSVPGEASYCSSPFISIPVLCCLMNRKGKSFNQTMFLSE